ncbi:MAG: HIT family protein [Promethearchaeota archaeon]
MREKECIFCKIKDKEIPSKVVFEDDSHLAFLDIFPISKGHTIIIPKNHYNNIEDISENELAEVFKIVRKISLLIHKKLKIDGYNIIQNNFPAAGQVINHFHVHIIPRNLNDGKFKMKIPKNQATEDELNSILNSLKS